MNTYGMTDQQMAGIVGGVSAAYYVVYIIVAIFMIVCLWKIFAKANEPGWAAIVPFYNYYVEFKIAWGNGWKFLLLLIPVANIVFAIMLEVKMAKAFGKGGGFAAGLIFLPVIFYPILAFGNAQYIGPQE